MTAVLACCVIAPRVVSAHGDVHERIVAFTKQIETSPTNAILYFERGELYRIDRDWTNALADLDRAQKIDPSLTRIDFCRGRILYEADDPKAALAPLNRYIAKQTNDAEAFATRARAQMKLGAVVRSADDFTEAIAIVPTGSPELYIERAQALSAAGRKEDAVRGLDQGIRRMGPLVTLELPAIDMEVQLKQYDAALARVDVVTSRLQRKESWLVRRAEILQAAGRNADATKAYRSALQAIEKLPPSHRHTRATLQLEASIRSALKADGPPVTAANQGAR